MFIRPTSLNRGLHMLVCSFGFSVMVYMWFDFIQYHLNVVASVMVCRTLFANIKSIKIFVKGKINKNWVYTITEPSFWFIYFLTRFIYFQLSMIHFNFDKSLPAQKKKKKCLHRKICWNFWNKHILNELKANPN
jgi:hypothetical protein